MLMPFLALALAGCGEFWAGVERNRQLWNAYRTSPAWYDHTYSATVTAADGARTTCLTTVNTYYQTSETTCY